MAKVDQLEVGPRGLIERAAGQLRKREVDASWAEVSQDVMRRVRAYVRPGKPVDVRTPEGSLTFDEAGSRTRVSDRVLLTLMREALDPVPGLAPATIDPVIDAGRCVGLHLEIVAAYGTDLHALASLTRLHAARVVSEALGYGAGDVPIDVTIVDVVPGDPKL